jgi:putative FmdB family regulatory protein
MPTYDYKCTTCGYTFEMFQNMTANPLEKCPKCGGKLKRLIGTGAGPIFKGKGFYQTDYKNNSNKPIKDKKKESSDNPSNIKKKE